MATSHTMTQTTPPIWARTLLGGAAAAAVNLGVYLAGTAAGASMVVSDPNPMTIPWPAAIVASILPLALGGVVAWLLAKRKPAARVWLAWAGLVFALVSCAALIGAPDTATALSLGAMHVVAGAAWFAALTVKTKDRRVRP